jgi:regulator of cell morphogenesis and NO signaling
MPAAQKPDPRTTVADFALEVPSVIPLLDELGIEYCCQGEKTLQQACAEAGVPVERLVEAGPAGAERPHRWQDEPLFGVVAHLEDQHHFPARRHLVRLERMLHRLSNDEKYAGGQARVLKTVFHRLMRGLLAHMSREEGEVFPYVTMLETQAARGEPLEGPDFGSLRRALEALRHEHEGFRLALRELREMTGGYTLPPEAPLSWRILYREMQAFESALRRHLHLENNVLFPRALALEARRVAAAREDAR